MQTLFHDKVLAAAVASSAVVHLAVVSGVPAFRDHRSAPVDEPYIEFIYYQVHADQADLEAVAGNADGDAPPAEEAAVTLSDGGRPSKDIPDRTAESSPKEAERRIAIKVREEEAAAPDPVKEGVYNEGRLINEYARTLDRIIERHGALAYPNRPREKLIEGSVLVHFRVREDGSLKSARVREDDSPACREFEEAALRAVERASAHFPPFPEGMTRKEILFTLPVSFTLE